MIDRYTDFDDDGGFSDDFMGRAELEAVREVDKEIAARLAILEALDPSQKRPAPKPNRTNYVEF